MDLGSETVVDDGDGVEIRSNESCVNGIGNGVGDSENHVETDPVEGLNCALKGKGLRKWRRIPRAVGSEGGGNAVDDLSRKRGMSGFETPGKGRNGLVEADRDNNIEGSVGTVNMTRNTGVGDEFGFGFGGGNPDSRYAGVGDEFGSAIGGASSDSRYSSVFVARADSANSEDRSSKSSTAASAPRGRYDVPLAGSHPRSRMKNAITKSWNNSAQSAQPRREESESSKKHRGDRVRMKKENSVSSMESDSRSSNFVFVQDAPLSSNGKKSRRSMSQEGENSDDAHVSEQHFSEEVQTGDRRENVVEVEEFSRDLDTDSSWVRKVDRTKKHGSFADMDPLAESMFNFQKVQEALQKEVQKFKEIGKESISSSDKFVRLSDTSSNEPEIIQTNLFNQLSSEKIGQKFSNSFEAQILSLKQHVKLMEGQLDETRARLEAKESRVTELEDIDSISKTFKEESVSPIELQEEKHKELEAYIESLYREKIESEVKDVVIKATTQKVKLATGNQIAFIEEQEAVAGEQERILNKLGKTQIRAAKLKEQAEELGKYCGDVLGPDDVFTMPKKLFKVTSCIFVQFVLLVIALWFSFMQSTSPPPRLVVPT